MADNIGTNASQKKEPIEVKVRPTLFIGVGGTGMEILQRVRKRVLEAVWGGAANPVRVSSLTEFPVAQFMHVDLDSTGANLAGNVGAGQSVFAPLIEFTDEEKIVHPLDSNKYFISDGELDQYPHIQSWMPLTRKKFLELNIDPTKGAGQIRALSRLYFYDKYDIIRNNIRAKIGRLKNGVSSEKALKRLALELDPGMRVVVVSSAAGGTGSGAFLDMGYVAKLMANETGLKNNVDLILLLPGGYAAYGKDRTEANGYASLMELETLMSQDVKFVDNWERGVPVTLPMKPYDEVYLCETTNIAVEGTSKVGDIYDMVADTLFEDFTSEKFGKRKRSIAPNTAQYKTGGFIPPFSSRYGQLNLNYSKAFSAFGQFTIDTQLEHKKNAVLARHVNDMLKQFFGIAADDTAKNQVSDADRDALLTDRMFLGSEIYTLKYKYAGEPSPGFEEDAEKSVPRLIDELLRIDGKSLLDDLIATINNSMEGIKGGGDKDQWSNQIASLKKQIERDAFKNVDVGSGIHEDNLAKRRAQLYAQLTADSSDLVRALWERVDNNERGGLDYTIELISRVKDRLENAETGLIGKIDVTGKWFEDLSGRIKADEIKVLEEHLAQTKGRGLFSFNKETQAEAKINQLTEALGMWITSHLRAVACREAITLLKDLSDWLGKKTGTDSNGEPIWKGFIGKLQEGRALVRSVMAEMSQEIARTEEAMKSAHATYQVIPATITIADQKVDPQTIKAWATETFSNYGGKRELFKRLENVESRAELISELRNVALGKLPEDVNRTRENPLFDALRKYPDRSGLFEKCLKRAMPWVDANLGGTFVSRQDNYSCVIGVANATEFDKEFGEEFRKAVPTQAGITAKKIEFEESGIPGRLTCYIEFSGLPLTALRQLRNWRISYDKEGKMIPVHTHKDSTLFVHPIAPTSQELDQMAEDYQLFLHGVVLGVLQSRKGTNEYEVKKRGNRFSIGNERAVRLAGVAGEHRGDVVQQVAEALDKSRGPYQLAGLAALLEYYTHEVFLPRKIKDELGVEKLSESLGYVLCKQLHDSVLNEFRAKAKAQKLDPDGILDRLNANLDVWTEIIRGSEKDGYLNEVHEDRLAKRVVRPEFFQAGWLEDVIGLGGTAVATPSAVGIVPPVMPLPIATQIYVHVNGAPLGPYDIAQLAAMVASAQLTPMSLVWKAGMANWMQAGGLPELAPLFLSAAPPPVSITPFYVAVNGRQSGPHVHAILQQMVDSGELTPKTQVWKNGMVKWLSAGDVPELASLFGAVGGPPPLNAEASGPPTIIEQ